MVNWGPVGGDDAEAVGQTESSKMQFTKGKWSDMKKADLEHTLANLQARLDSPESFGEVIYYNH